VFIYERCKLLLEIRFGSEAVYSDSNSLKISLPDVFKSPKIYRP